MAFDLKSKLSTLAGTSTPQRVDPVTPVAPTATSTPTTTLSQQLSQLPGATISQGTPSNFERFKAALPKGLREGLFGVGQTVDMAGNTKFDTGLIGFLWGGLTKSDSQKFYDRRERLIGEGINEERASQLSFESLSGDGMNLNAKEERIIRNAKLWDLGETALDALDFIPGLGTVVGATGDVTRQIFKRLAKIDDLAEIEKTLVDTFRMERGAARRVAPEIAASKSEAVIATKINDIVRPATRAADTATETAIKTADDVADTRRAVTSQNAPEIAKRVEDVPEIKLPSKTVQRRTVDAEKATLPDEFFVRRGDSFEKKAADDVLEAPIGKDLDTFVTKTDEGYAVFEGVSGQQVGDTAETVAAAIDSAKAELGRMTDDEIKQFIDDSPLSPRYQQVEDVAQSKGISLPEKVKGRVTTADRLPPPIDKTKERKRLKLVQLAKRSSSVDNFVGNSGITREALDQTVKKAGFKDVEEYYAKNGPGKVSKAEARTFDEGAPEQAKPDLNDDTELQSYELMAEGYQGSEFVTAAKQSEAEQIIDNLQQIFADMKGIDIDDPALKFTDEDLFRAQSEYEFINDALMDDPARALMRYVSPKTGKLPEVTGTEFIRSISGSQKLIRNSTFGRRGDDIITELGFESLEDAIKGVENYIKRRDAAKEVFQNLQQVREGIRLAKQMNQFVGKNQKALATELAKNQKALHSIVVAAEKAGFRQGFKTGQKKYQTLVDRLRSRRQRFAGLKWAYELTDGELKRIQGDVDPRFMTKEEFDTYMTELDDKARDIVARRTERGIIKAIIEQKSLKNTENLREAMQLPPLTEMNLEQLGKYESMLSKLQDFDEVLSKRTLEVIDRTSLKGARTVRQVRNFLAQELERTFGKKVQLSDLENLVADNFDPYIYDAALAEKQPFYTFLVHRTHKHLMEGEANFLRLQNRFETLVRRANKSRKRSLGQKIKQKFIPTKPEIIRYLEARGEEKDLFAKALTKEELELANFMRNYYNSVYNYLSYINELHGSRYIDAYFTHVRKGFLEKWSDDGFIDAMKSIWDQQKEDMAIANIIDKDTGQILPKSKFFQYTLRRTGEGEVSQNATRVFLQYAKLFERKKMLDKMVPELDVYTRSLTPKDMTPRGLEMNRKMKDFVYEYLNNKRGRRAKYMYVAQNSVADMLLRGGNMMVSLFDLGLNFTAGTAAFVGEQMANYALLGAKGTIKGYKRRIWDTGVKRLTDSNAKKILKDNEAFIGRDIWKELSEVDQTPFDQGIKTMFGLFHQSTVEANKIYFLASLTKEELKAGKITAERLAELKINAARWRDMGRDMKSIVGSTSPGQVFTKYKSWAVPILQTTARNYKLTAGRIARGEIKDLAKSREIKEIIRQAETVAVAVYLGAVISGHDDDDSYIGKLKARISQEAMTLLGGLDPRFFLASPRLVSWLTTLSDNLIELATLEEYKSDSKYGDKGDLKGWGGLKQQFIPGFIRQFLPSKSGGSSSTAPTSTDRTRRTNDRNRDRVNPNERRRNPNETRQRQETRPNRDRV